MIPRCVRLFASILAIFSLPSLIMAESQAGAEAHSFSASDLEFFEKEVRPLLVHRCYECHGPDAKTPAGGLLLTSRSAVLEGGDSGAAIEPGKPTESMLIESVHYQGFYQMPPKSKLPQGEIEILERWVKLGAPWPAEDEKHRTQRKPFDLEVRKQSHWSWQPVTNPPIPKVNRGEWPSDPIDNFVLARLEAKSITPSPPAERLTLLRRLHFDLTGLPPTPEQIAAFQQDASQAAVAKVIDNLLDSPRFGEHWARHWLDLVRYAESRGHEFDFEIPNAHAYRDYVIRAINGDIPFDQFVHEQIAGDLLPNPRTNPEHGFNESVLGTGFWHLGDWVHSPVDIRKDEADRFDNMLDVLNKATLGLTVSCARCHDHKFDAISQADYYAQAGFLQSSSYRQVRYETLIPNKKVSDQLTALDAQTQRQLKQILNRELTTIRDQSGQHASWWQSQFAKAAQDTTHPLHWWEKWLGADENARSA